MSGQKQASEKLLEQKNRRKPETTPAVEQGQNSLGVLDIPVELFLGSQDNHDSSQDILLNTGNLQEAQKIALALKINRVQGNNHLQRVISAKRRKDEGEEESEKTRTGAGIEEPPALERGGNGHNKEATLEAPIHETRIKPGRNGNRSRAGGASGVERGLAGNEKIRAELGEEPEKLESLDREGLTIAPAKTREAEQTGSVKGGKEVPESPEPGAGEAIKGEVVSEPGEKPGKIPEEIGEREAAPGSGSAEIANSVGPEEAPRQASEVPNEALAGGGGSGEALGTEWQAAGGKQAVENIPAPAFETTMPFSAGSGAKADPLSDLASHTAYQKLKVGDAVKAQQEQLVTEGNANKSKFIAEMGIKLSAAYAACNTQKDTLEQQRKIQKNKIEDERKARKQEIEQGYNIQLVALMLSYTKRKAEMIKNGATRAASVRAFAQKSKERIAASTMAKFSRAMAIGEEKAKFYAPQKRGADIGNVSRKIAANMAGKIMQSGYDAINAVGKDGNDKASEISEMASKAASKFSEGLVKSLIGLINAREKAKREIDKVADLLIKKVDPIIDNSITAINGIKIPLLTNMTKVAAGFPAKVDMAVVKGKQALAYAGQQRIDDIQDGFMVAYNKIRGTSGLKGRRLRRLITRLTLMMTASREASVGEIERGGAILKANQGKGLTESIGKLGELIGRLQLELTNAFLALTKGFDAMLQGAGMVKISSLAIGTMALVVVNYDSKLVEAIGKASSELDKAVTRCQDGITKKENLTQNAQTNMLLELDKKIDKKARDMQRSWIVRGLLGLGGFLYGLGKSVLKFLAIILAVVIALALLAAAIGAIVGLVFVILSSLIGAALAGMIAVIVGLVLAAAAGLAALAAMAYGIYTLGKTVWQNIIAIFTDDSLTAFERGSMAGETAGDVAMTVLPFIPKVRIGAGNLLSKVGARLRIPFLKGRAPKLEAGAPAEPAAAVPAKPSALAPTEPMPAARPGEGLPAPADVVRGRPSPYATTEKMPAVRPEELPAPAEVVPAKPSPLPPTEPMPAVPAKPSPPLGKTEPPLGTPEPVPGVRPAEGILAGAGEIPGALPRPFEPINDLASAHRLWEYFVRTPGKAIRECFNKQQMSKAWREFGQKSEPPAAFIDSNGHLTVDASKIGEMSETHWMELMKMRRAAETRAARAPAKPPTESNPALGKTEPPLGPSEPAPAVRPGEGGAGGPGEVTPPLRGEPTLPPIKPKPPVRQPYAAVPRGPIAERINDISRIKRLREYFYRTPGKVVLELHKIEMYQRWRALGQKGDPPAAFISSKGYLYVDINKVGELNLSRWAELNRIREAAAARGARGS